MFLFIYTTAGPGYIRGFTWCL